MVVNYTDEHDVDRYVTISDSCDYYDGYECVEDLFANYHHIGYSAEGYFDPHNHDDIDYDHPEINTAAYVAAVIFAIFPLVNLLSIILLIIFVLVFVIIMHIIDYIDDVRKARANSHSSTIDPEITFGDPVVKRMRKSNRTPGLTPGRVSPATSESGNSTSLVTQSFTSSSSSSSSSSSDSPSPDSSSSSSSDSPSPDSFSSSSSGTYLATVSDDKCSDDDVAIPHESFESEESVF